MPHVFPYVCRERVHEGSRANSLASVCGVDAGELTWPDRWQPDAIEALLPYLDTDARVRIVLDDPKVAVSGTVIEGHVYVENGEPMIVHDRSGRPDVFPWRLLLGPVQRIELLIPSRRPVVLFEHEALRN